MDMRRKCGMNVPLRAVLIGLAVLFVGADSFAGWPMFHHDVYRTGLSPLTGDMDTCYFFWSYAAGDKIESSPALGDIDGDGHLEVVVGCRDGLVYALNGEDGSFLWSYTTGGQVKSSPALGDIDDDGNLEVVVGSADFSVYALNGVSIAVEEVDILVPRRFFVAQNRPNPFARATQIGYGLAEMTNVRIDVFDLSGRLVTTLVDGMKSPGGHTATWDGRDDSGRYRASGTYFYTLQAGDKTVTKKMHLVR